MNYIDQLNAALEAQLRTPWSRDRSGGERVWFLVFDPDKTRNVLARKDLFELTTRTAGKKWVEIDVTHTFGEWMQNHPYASSYFEFPDTAIALPEDFSEFLAREVRKQIEALEIDERTLVALVGTEALFGINKLSHIVRLIEDAVPGRLLVFFPGEYTEPHYRFLDARDGWNYLAIPLTAADGR